MPTMKSDNKIHEQACAIAESNYQAAVAAADGTPGALRTAETVRLRAIISSCKSNNLPFIHFSQALFLFCQTDGT
jgi:hypothetical protein